MPFMTERPLTPREFLDECIAFKRERLTGGRFLAALVQGNVTAAQLRLWAKDMYHFVQPGIPALTAWLAHATTALCAFCRSSFAEGLGAFGLALEMQVPGRPNGAAVLYEALRRLGLSESALEFYRIHVEAEEEHGENAERAVAPFIQTREQQALVRHAFRWTVIALAGMQQGFDAYLS